MSKLDKSRAEFKEILEQSNHYKVHIDSLKDEIERSKLMVKDLQEN